MKTERRHDLETNELARWATVWVEKIKPYSNAIFAGVVVLLGVVAVGSMWGSSSEAEQEAAWDAYALAIHERDLDMNKMQQVAADPGIDGTVVQAWAFAVWADRQLFLASQGMLIDRESAQKRLESVEKVYSELTQVTGDDQLLNLAHYGLGQVYELQNRFDEAQDEYDQVGGAWEALARARADHLLAPGVKENFEWLATAQLPKRTLEGAPGTPGARPDFEADLPDASSVPLNVGPQSFEEIFGGSSDEKSEDRYGESGKSAEGETFEEMFGEEEPASEAASSDATDATTSEDANQP